MCLYKALKLLLDRKKCIHHTILQHQEQNLKLYVKSGNSYNIDTLVPQYWIVFWSSHDICNVVVIYHFLRSEQGNWNFVNWKLKQWSTFCYSFGFSFSEWMILQKPWLWDLLFSGPISHLLLENIEGKTPKRWETKDTCRTHLHILEVFQGHWAQRNQKGQAEI